MGALPGSHEIVELTEIYDWESNSSGNTGKLYVGKPLKKYSIEDDINKLFEAINIGNSRRGVGQQEHSRVREALSKSAMKRPMRVGPSQVSSIGISESVNLKQALRGLCIAQASEMAAVKRRISRPSASPGFSEAGAIRGLYRAMESEASEADRSLGVGKENMVEILLIPERSSPNFWDKAPETEQVSKSDLSERNAECSVRKMGAVVDCAKITKTIPKKEINPFSTTAGCRISEDDFKQNATLELQSSSLTTALDKKVQVSDAIVPKESEGSITAGGRHKGEVDKLHAASSLSSFNVESKQIKTSNRGFGSSKQRLRTQNMVKKKILPKATILVDNCSQREEKSDSNHDCDTNNLVCQTPNTILEKGCEDLEKVTPASGTNATLIGSITSLGSHSNKRDLVPHIVSKSKRVQTVTNEISRSKEKGEISQSSKSSIGDYSSTSYSEESYLSGSSRSGYRPHMSKDFRWEAISCIQKQQGSLGLRHFKLLRKLGGGDIGTVYLSELIGTSCLFAVKLIDNEFLASKKKLLRAQAEKEILEILDHPFLPTLYAHFTTKKFSCMVMEYCPGGDLHVLRQKQPTKSFSEPAARFYVAEVLLALEYLHMLGVVYRDLKPENILVREDGHIMLSDFDLSLRCAANPMLLKSSSPIVDAPKKTASTCSDTSCIDPFCLQPSWQFSCFTPRFLSAASKTSKLKSELASQILPLPQIVVEPTDARSNSFVGTHEYLAPEIIKGEGHGSAVDWWTFGIFLYELLYGKTPFKGSRNEDTISNVVSQCLKFPECPMVSSHARDLIRRLLRKEPENRLGSTKGAAEIKQHPFFDGLNWALIRCETPPELPKFFDLGNVVPDSMFHNKTIKTEFEGRGDEIEFEMF